MPVDLLEHPDFKGVADAVGLEMVPKGQSPDGYASERGFVEWIALAAAIVQAVQLILKDCNMRPESVVSLCRGGHSLSYTASYDGAKKAVASQFSWIGRILHRGKIDRAATDIAAGCRRACSKSDPETIERLMVASREA